MEDLELEIEPELTLAEIRARIAEKKAERELREIQAKASGEDFSNEKPEKINNIVLDPNTDYIAIPATDFENFVHYNVHYCDEQGNLTRIICDEHFRRVCKICSYYLSVRGSAGDWRFRPKAVVIGPYHFINLVGSTCTVKDHQGKDVVRVLVNFVRKLELPYGQKDGNLKALRNIAKDKSVPFTQKYIRFKRIPGEGYELPEPMDEEEVRNLVGPEKSITMPPSSARFTELSKMEIKELLLRDFKNPDIALLYGKKPKVTDETVVDDPFANDSEDSNLSDIESAF